MQLCVTKFRWNNQLAPGKMVFFIEINISEAILMIVSNISCSSRDNTFNNTSVAPFTNMV